MARTRRGEGLVGRLAGLAVAVAAVLAGVLVLSAVHLLPQLRNPFTETTTDRSQPVLLKSITALSRYEAASGSFQVVVDLSKRTAFLPSFIEGSDTLFVGQGTEIAVVDFSQLGAKAIRLSASASSTIASKYRSNARKGGSSPPKIAEQVSSARRTYRSRTRR